MKSVRISPHEYGAYRQLRSMSWSHMEKLIAARNCPSIALRAGSFWAEINRRYSNFRRVTTGRKLSIFCSESARLQPWLGKKLDVIPSIHSAVRYKPESTPRTCVYPLVPSLVSIREGLGSKTPYCCDARNILGNRIECFVQDASAGTCACALSVDLRCSCRAQNKHLSSPGEFCNPYMVSKSIVAPSG
jgi:hypothetical protein